MAIFLVTFRKEVQTLVDSGNGDAEDVQDAVNGMLRDVDGMEDFADDHQAQWKASVRAPKPGELAGSKPLKIDHDADT